MIFQIVIFCSYFAAFPPMSHYAPAAGKLFLPADGQGQAHHVGSPRLTQHPAASDRVAPVVQMSSISRKRFPAMFSGRTASYTPRTLARRASASSRPDWARVVRCLAQGLLGLHMPLHAQAPGQIPGLVKAPPAQTLPAHRHPGDGIELAAEFLRGAAGHETAEAGQPPCGPLNLKSSRARRTGILIVERRSHPEPDTCRRARSPV